MNKFLVAVFNSEDAAYEGLSALRDLHRDGDISLYATAVITKDSSGTVHVKKEAEREPIGTAIGLFAGSLVGLLAGPAGLAVGASMGTLTGFLADLNKSGTDYYFLEDLSKALTSGKAAVLAEVQETWTTPADKRIGELGGMVFRRFRSEVVDDQLARDAAAYEASMKQLKEELKHATEETKAAIRKEMDDIRKKAQETRDRIKAKLDQAKNEADAKVHAMQDQLKQARDRQKARLEKGIDEAKADFGTRKAKLEQATTLIKEALAA